MNSLYHIGRNCFVLRIASARFIPLLLAVTTTTALADWPNANATKYVQPPDLSAASYNVLAAQPPAGSGTGLPLILADDFPCTQTGPITDIHIWASWLGDTTATFIVPDMPITLGFWSDVPASPASGPSRPGTLLWSQTFLPGGAIPGHYKRVVAPPGWAPSQFWDPDPPPAGQIMGNDNIIWLYNFYPDPGQPNGLFVQQGTAAAPTNYWLSVTAGTNLVAFGWRTSAVHYNDDAVFGHMDPATGTIPLGDWQELSSPQTPTTSLDLAFALTTANQPPPPPPSTNKIWVQYPDKQSGFGLDVNATSPNAANGLLTLADDFKCYSAGQITNIQFWASFNNDMPPGANTFVVSIWSDAATGPNGFSQPGQWLWSQTYGPGDYLPPTSAGTGTEHFYDPLTHTLSPESVVWLYSFNLFPSNPFCQQGNGTVYWVSIASLSPPAANWQWGWKTSTNHWGDAGVYGKEDPISHNLLVPWLPLSNPLVAAGVPAPVDFAFQISSGPPNPDCDPALTGAGFIQPPDTSNNGLDVWDMTNTILGDDFLCRVSGNISGFTIWGSWLNDQVDTNALFQVSLWSDVPALPGNSPYSHPGSLLCSTLFSPPQTIGSALRYQYSLFKSNVMETFYNPNLPGSAGLIGNDTQIWRYDFFPFLPSCFEQQGGPFAASKIYWLTVSYIPVPGNTTADVFGWKTSTTHFQDAAVYGTNGIIWNPLSDPRSGTQLDLSKVVWKFPVVGKNEDIYNLTPLTADGIQIILSGTHLVTWHYDDVPAWSFMTYPTNGGDTVLQWYGRTVPSGGVTHVGYETPGTVLPTVLAMNWLSGTNVIGTIVQQNYHLLGDPTAVELNDFYPGTLIPGTASVEYYATPPPLDQMINGGTRNPLATIPIISPGPIGLGGAGTMSLPPSPQGAQYAMIIVVLDIAAGAPGAQDFVLLPLDTAIVPAVQSIGISGGSFIVHINSAVGRSYQLQSTVNLNNPTWINAGSPVMAVSGDTILTAPMTGAQNFYRVMLMP